MRLARVERVPAHVRDLQRRIGRRDPVDLAARSSRGPAVTSYSRPRSAMQLHADADAEERPALAAHRLLQRLDHARHRVEPAPAVGEGADARQHDAVGAAHRVGIAGDHDRLRRARSRARRARTPWRPSADCRSRSRRWRRSSRSAVIGRAAARGTGRSRPAGRRRRVGAGGETSARIGRRRRPRHRAPPRRRRSAARPSPRSSATTTPSVASSRGARASSAAASPPRSRSAARSATPTANFTSAGHAERPQPDLQRRDRRRDRAAAPATAGATAARAAPSRNAQK